MQILNGLDGLRHLPHGGVLSVGNFDGLHLGHREILRRAKALCGQGGGAMLAVITFEPHPLTVLKPQSAPPRLTSPSLKQSLLRDACVDYLVILPPQPEVLNLSAEEFWRILHDEVRAAHLVEGPSFNFGKGRTGTIEKLREWAARGSVRLMVVDRVEVPLVDSTVVPVSSSLVRWLLTQGRVRDAAICLHRPYMISGEVVRGHQRGRGIGIPTANLRCTDQLIPGDGVYVARCTVDDVTHPVALSIGSMPTFGTNARQVEAHLLDFTGDLYGRTLAIELVDWVRGQSKFKAVDALKLQLARDVRYVAERAGLDPAIPISRAS